jgi:hypothetical protein
LERHGHAPEEKDAGRSHHSSAKRLAAAAGCAIPVGREGRMIKKTLSILALSGLLLLPLSCSKKSEELSDSEVNEVFNTLCLVIDRAMSQANASATTISGHVAESRHAADIITRYINWAGEGDLLGVSLVGWITVNTDTYEYNGEVTIAMGLYDASSDQNILIINSLNGKLSFNGVAAPTIQSHHAEHLFEFDMIIGTTQYIGAAEYDVDALGSAITISGTVVLNGKSYPLH